LARGLLLVGLGLLVLDTAEARPLTGTGSDDLQPGAVRGLAAKDLVIPRSHPRIWWTPERLARARTWFGAHPFQPRANDPGESAMCYLLTGQQRYAQVAINALLKFEISERELKPVACNKYRWSDWVPLVFDWVHDAMTPAQRQEFMQRYNHYVEVLSQKPWGGPSMPTNNYYWGYFRNELNWAIASYHENPRAPEFLQFALEKRWDRSFLPFAAGRGRGGVPDEGSQYGVYMLNYPVLPFATLRALGRPMHKETDFFKEAVFQQIYATTPAPTYRKGMARPYYQTFPFGDDEMDGGYPGVHTGDFMTVAAEEWANVAVGAYARRWLHEVRPQVSRYVAAADRGGPERDPGTLPLDYYASGVEYLYCRNRWGPQATCLFLQLGQPSTSAHSHHDQGTFQIWRNGRWLSKETTGYAQRFADGNAASTACHNALLFNGIGLANAYPDGPPRILRLDSRPEYAYAVVDLTDTYRSHRSRNRTRDDNPAAGRVVREFLFIRPLETLVILDRLESTGEKGPAEDVTKTFLLHFPERPAVSGANEVVGINGEQSLRLTTLLPRKPEFRVVDEGDFQGKHLAPSYYQFRLEVNDRGQQQSYFLNVLSPEGGGQSVRARLEENGTSWTAHLERPGSGQAVVVFHKGMQPSEASFGYDAAGVPGHLISLSNRVQHVRVTDQGPMWLD
jgi:hypothetical protein